MIEEKNKKDNDLLNLVCAATSNSTTDIFLNYSKYKIYKELKPIYNLFAESFLSINSYCILMFNKAWAQAGTILRIAIEQISTLHILVIERRDLIPAYVDLLKMKRFFLVIGR